MRRARPADDVTAASDAPPVAPLMSCREVVPGLKPCRICPTAPIFKYNTAATFMQSAIVRRSPANRARVFSSRACSNRWDRAPGLDANFQGIGAGVVRLRVRTEDIAKLGQLYLQRGLGWRTLLPADWVAMAT